MLYLFKQIPRELVQSYAARQRGTVQEDELIVHADMVDKLIEVASASDAVLLPCGFNVVAKLLICEEEFTGVR